MNSTTEVHRSLLLVQGRAKFCAISALRVFIINSID